MRSLAQTLPEVIVSVENARLERSALLGLESLRVQQRLSLPALCELVFCEQPAGGQVCPPSLAPGAALEVSVSTSLGIQDAGTPLFSGEVTAVERSYGPAGQREVRVRGYDLLQRLRQQQSLRAFVQVTPAELAREMTAALGLTVMAADPGPLWQTLIQHLASDFDLLQRITAPYGLYLLLEGRTLHLLPLAGTGERVSLKLGQTLLEARVETNTLHKPGSLRVDGWDPLKVEPLTGEAGGLGGHQAAVLGGAMHEGQHAEQLAQAEYTRRCAREHIFWGIAEGSSSLHPGVTVGVSGGDEHLAGEYVLTAVNHTIDGRKGFVSELTSLPPEPPVADPAARVTLAEVTSVDDPHHLGRVRVRLPAYAETETGWLQVLSAAAGQGKGLVAIPEVADRVLVLFVQANPGLALVLGGLFGMGGPEDSGVDNAAVQRYTFHTRGGQRICLDDAKNILRCENSRGSYVELSPDAVQLYAAADLDIAAPGRKITIRGSSIDFERA